MMFFGASAFNQDLSAWDVSSIATMDLMFNGLVHLLHSIRIYVLGLARALNYIVSIIFLQL